MSDQNRHEDTDGVNVPPHDAHAEQAVVASLLFGDKAVVDELTGLLMPEDFYRSAHGEIFAAMQAMAGRAEPIDVVTLKDTLTRRKTLDTVGGVSYLMQLSDAAFTSANVLHYARIVKNTALRRSLAKEAKRIYQAAMAGEIEATEQLENAEKALFALRPNDADGRNLRHLREWVTEGIDELDQREYEHREGIQVGTQTGFLELDYKLSGLHPGELIILAARPSVGKSALATGILENIVRGGGNVLLFSLEMSGSMLTQRILSAAGRVDAHAVRTGDIQPEQWRKVMEGAQVAWRGECYIDQTTDVTPAYLRATTRRVSSKLNGLDLVIVDYLQLLSSGGQAGKSANRNEEISIISRALKLLAGEFNVPVLALSQLSRAVMQRENKRPQLSDLRDSGSLEQDADVVLMMYRESYEKQSGEDVEGEWADVPGEVPHDERPLPTEVIVQKQRNGPLGPVTLGFTPKFARFDNWDDRHEEVG